MSARVRSEDWILAYNNSSPEDELQIQVVSLLAQSIHSSQEQIYIERSGKLVGLFNSAIDLSIKKLNTRMHTKNDAFWRLIHLELSPSLEKKLKDIVTRRMAISDRFTEPDKKGTTIPYLKPKFRHEKMYMKKIVPSLPVVTTITEDQKSFAEGELIGKLVEGYYGSYTTTGLASAILPAGLPQRLLANYTYLNRKEYVLTRAEMFECKPEFSLLDCKYDKDNPIPKLRQQGGKLATSYEVKGIALLSGTLGQFTINFRGILYFQGDLLLLKEK
jgi:hypothetical protein